MSNSPVLAAVRDKVKGPLGAAAAYIAPSTSNAGGYHNSRDRLLAIGKTGDYSVQLAADKAGAGDHWCALDLTGEAATRLLTNRIKAAVDRKDPRIRCLREFLGSHDNKQTVRYTHDSPDGDWRVGSKPDPSHLTHGHASLFRQFEKDMSVVDGLVDVFLGRNTPSDGGGGGVTSPNENAKAVWAYDPNDPNDWGAIRNQPWRGDYETNPTVAARWALEESWRLSHEANEALKRVEATLAALPAAVWQVETTNPARLDENKQPRPQHYGDFVRWSESMHFSARNMILAAIEDKSVELSDEQVAGIVAALSERLGDQIADRITSVLPDVLDPDEVRQAVRLGVVDTLRLGTDAISG